ncbi:hypothetical protein Drose_26920 [Dactylosporangium roseum]|uniref:Teneurin-like YD-shell domain-containing protein n=1 Tax=Dactylosporangium roseum TaxID=47989 RepID=A0ABY5YZK6_9ACTN|nr:polymorphic toxin-type HINT domain-containing protein [Dactylosporangium roseum]UWZ34801.1 hypothetical protein Drose_26920 [Dactylosporangium roseum]
MTDRAGVKGVVFTLARADGGTGSAPVGVDIDYTDFRDGYGVAGFGSRLVLVSLPACVLSTPEVPACQEQIPVPGATNVETSSTVSVPQLTLAPASAGSSGSAGAGGGSVFALAAGNSSQTGDFRQTSLSPAGSWAGGGQSGDFTYAVPLRMPASLGGPAPSLSLGYSSGSVDARTAGTNSQPSQIGEGWDLPIPFIERSYRSCREDGGSTGDLCQMSRYNATLSFNGVSTSLVRDSNSGVWVAKDDSGLKIESLTGAANYTADGAHWRVTTQDGTQYYFGLNRLPTAASNGSQDTYSAAVVPVYGNNPGDYCYTGTFSGSWCNVAYRWNLDYVVDPRGNTMTYFYDKYFNGYGANNNTRVAAYDAAVYVKRIEYGTRKDQEFVGHAPVQVIVSNVRRCADAPTCSSWPDTPWDLSCATTASSCPGVGQRSPTFWSPMLVEAVLTQVWDAGSGTYKPVDRWNLRHDFPANSDGTTPQMWLRYVDHIGLANSTAASEPTIGFYGQELDNRVDSSTGLGVPKAKHWRMSMILTGPGGQIDVAYSAPECSPSSIPAAADDNIRLCFPQWSAPEGGTAGFGWFHKYVTTSVIERDNVGGSPPVVTSYLYDNDRTNAKALWHWDTNEIALTTTRTWSQFRGYSKVTTIAGGAGPTTTTSRLYYRGMDGDRLASGGARFAKITDLWGGDLLDQDPLRGFVREDTRWNGTLQAAGTTHTPSLTARGTRVEGWPDGTFTAYRVTETQTQHYERVDAVPTNVWSSTNTAYDSYGLPTDIVHTGVTGKETCTRTSYTQDAASNKVAYPYEVATYAGTTCGSGTLLSKSQTWYDGHANLTDLPGAGLPTKAQTLVTTSPSTVWSTATTGYDSYGRPVSSVDARGHTVTTAYTPASGGPVTQMATTDQFFTSGNTVTTTIDPTIGPITVVDMNGHKTEATYDALGRVTAVWKPTEDRAAGAPASEKYSYELNATAPSKTTAQVLQQINGPGNSNPVYLTSYTYYDGLLRTRNTQAPAPGGTGRMVTETKYDNRGNPATATAPFYNSSAAGSGLVNTAAASVPSQTVASYDNQDRLSTATLQALGVSQWSTSYSYDGDQSTVVPPDGGAARTYVDAWGRTSRLEVYPTSTVTGSHETTSYAYDTAGNLATLTDPAGNVTSYGYNLAGWRTSTTDPDTGTSTSSYNAAGDVIATTDGRGQTISHEYDQLGRETVRWANAISTGIKLATFTYDTLKKGLPTASTRWVGSDQFTVSVTGYTSRYQPTGQTWSIPMSQGALAGTYTIGYGYDRAEHPTSISYPAGGGLAAETVTTGYNTLGYPTTLTGTDPYVTATSYTQIGQLTQRVYGASGPGQLTRDYTWQPATGRLATITSKQPNTGGTGWTTIQNDTYTYTPTGDITRILDGTDNQSQCYRYDGQHRLTHAWTTLSGCTNLPTNADVDTSGKYPYYDRWSYDSANRQLAYTHQWTSQNAWTRVPTYGLAGTDPVHAATSVAQQGAYAHTDTMTYDNAGNTKQRTINGVVTDFTFNPENQFSAATVHATGGDQQTVHRYDATGALLIRLDPSGSTLYAAGQEYKAVGGTVTATRYYTHAGTTVAVRNTTGCYWLAADHQASANLTVNTTTGAVQRRWYTPYGADRATQGTWPTDRGFLNKQTNTSTGLLDVGAREYDPDLGTFISPDPFVALDSPTTFNAYAYAGHNPITHSDPSGLSWWGNLQEYLVGLGDGLNPFNVANETVEGINQVVEDPGRVVDDFNAEVDRWEPEYGPLAPGCVVVGHCQVIEDLKNGDYYEAGYGTAGVILFTAEVVAAVLSPAAGGLGAFRLMAAAAKAVTKVAKSTAKAAGKAAKAATKAAEDAVKVGKNAAKAGANAGESADVPIKCHSFDPSTPILMANGSTKAIEDVAVGDTVIATDPTTSETTTQSVTDLHVNLDTDLTDLTVMNEVGETQELKTTDRHPFWSDTAQNWVDAANLTPGDQLRTADHHTLVVLRVHSYIGAKTMRDLTVSNIHTYYVVAGNTPVLVHNCDPVSIYKAPGKGMTQKLLDDGFTPDDFPGSGNGYPDGRAYFGLGDEGKAIAQDYASRGGYDGTVIHIRIPRADFDQHFAPHVGSHNGVPRTEVAVPNTMFGILNRFRRELL